MPRVLPWRRHSRRLRAQHTPSLSQPVSRDDDIAERMASNSRGALTLLLDMLSGRRVDLREHLGRNVDGCRRRPAQCREEADTL